MKMSLKQFTITGLLFVFTMFSQATAQNIYMLNTKMEGGVTYTTCYDMLMPRSRNFGAIVNGQIVVPCKYSYVCGKGGHLFAYPIISIGPADVYTPTGLLLFTQSKGIVDAVKMRDSGKTLFVSQSNKWYDHHGEYLFTAADILGIGTSEPEWVASIGKYLIKDYKTNKWYDENGKYYGTYKNSSDIVVSRNAESSGRQKQTTISGNSSSGGIHDITQSFFDTNKKYFVKHMGMFVPGKESLDKKDFQWGEMDITVTNTLADRSITFRRDDINDTWSETLMGFRKCKAFHFDGTEVQLFLYITNSDDNTYNGYQVVSGEDGIVICRWIYVEKYDWYYPFSYYELYKD